MNEETNEEKFFVVEWTIENFSCWNSELHDQVITSPQFKYNFLKLNVYPRGTTGCGEHIEVQLINERRLRLLGDLSLLGSDESLIFTQEINTAGEEIVKFHPGPKFEEVIAQTRNSEEDKLIIRYRRRTTVYALVEYMRTSINVYDASVKISRERFEDLGKCKRISLLKFPLGNGSWGDVDLFIESNGYSKITVKLITSGGKFSAVIQASVLNKDGAVLKSERREHLFKTNDTISLNALKRKEVKKASFSFLVTVKVIPSSNYKHQGCYYYDPEKDVITSSNLILKHPNSYISEISSVNSTTSNKHDDPMTLITKDLLFTKIISSSEIPNKVVSEQPDDSVGVLTADLMCLYQDHDFSDFRLKCDNVSFPVHKNILSARSPVFKTMFSSDMKEAASGCMDVVDMDPSTLGLFLTYLYTGAVENLVGERAFNLYYAADKYQVPSLKRKCVSVLEKNVSILNVCDILSLADKHQDHQLKSAAQKFFLENFNEVLKSEGWSSFMTCEPLLAVTTVTCFAQKKFLG